MIPELRGARVPIMGEAINQDAVVDWMLQSMGSFPRLVMVTGRVSSAGEKTREVAERAKLAAPGEVGPLSQAAKVTPKMNRTTLCTEWRERNRIMTPRPLNGLYEFGLGRS
jgi:hypothetical protein